jgi:hypothetical protein
VASNAASSSGGVNAVTLKSNGGIGFTAEARVVGDAGKSAILSLSTHQLLTITIRNRIRGWESYLGQRRYHR